MTYQQQLAERLRKLADIVETLPDDQARTMLARTRLLEKAARGNKEIVPCNSGQTQVGQWPEE